MNTAHFHLMVNHLPIIGIPLITLLLAWGLYRRSRDVLQAAFGLTIILAAVSYPVLLTGEAAEERVEHAAWFDEARVDDHEERAEAALVGILATGALAALALWRMRRVQEIKPTLPAVVLGALLISSALFGWTALAGGRIRHDEIRPGAVAPESSAPLGAARGERAVETGEVER